MTIKVLNNETFESLDDKDLIKIFVDNVFLGQIDRDFGDAYDSNDMRAFIIQEIENAGIFQIVKDEGADMTIDVFRECLIAAESEGWDNQRIEDITDTYNGSCFDAEALASAGMGVDEDYGSYYEGDF